MFSYSKIGSFLLRGDDDNEGDGEPVGDGGGDGENRESWHLMYLISFVVMSKTRQIIRFR